MLKAKKSTGSRRGMKSCDTKRGLFFSLVLIILTLVSLVEINNAFAGGGGEKTYKNERHKYEVQQPSDLNLATPYGEDVVQIKGDSRFYMITTEELSGVVIKDNAQIPFSNLSTQEIVSMGLHRRCPEADTGLIDWVSIKIGGIEGIKAVNSEDNCIKKYLPWVAVKKNNKVYHFQFLSGSEGEFNKILSTFKFN